MLSFRYNFKQLISEIQVMENVSFINIDDEGIDFMRTPSYDFFQEEHERGVSVSFKNIEDSFRLKGVVLEVILFSQSSQSWIANRG